MRRQNHGSLIEPRSRACVTAMSRARFRRLKQQDQRRTKSSVGPSTCRTTLRQRAETVMLFEDKTAIVYGAAGSIGSAVARACPREGAEVHLAGRTEATLEVVADHIRHEGGTAHVTCLDVTDPAAVEEHAAAVAAVRGAIDICFNATSNDDIQGTPLLAMRFEDFLAPITKAVTHPRRGCQHRHLRRIGLGPHDRERNQLHRRRGHRLTQ